MRKIFTLIFVFLLLTPAVVWLIGLDFGVEVDRIGLKPPRFDGRALFENAYYLSYDQYFNDSFSLRSPLILAKRWLDYRIFHMTDVKGVHVGNNGWLYGRPSIDDYRKEACSGTQDIEQLVLELHAIERMFETSRRRFFFIVAPNKSTIYPEFVGPLPQGPSCNYSRYDLFLKAIEAHRLKSFVRLDQHLINAKKSHALLYDRTSRFWNGLGAMVASEAIQAQIMKNHKDKRPFGYKSSAEIDSGDLNKQLMGFLTRAQDAPVMHLTSSGQRDLPHGIIYGDDFLNNLIPYMAQLFSQLDVIRTDNLPSRQYGEDLRDCKLILLEQAESELGTTRIEIDKLFSIFEAEALIPIRYLLDLQTIIPGVNVSLNYKADGLEVKSVGIQSVFEFKSIPASDDDIFRVLKLTIEASHSDIMTVQHMNGPSLVIPKSLKSGITEVYLPLPFQKSTSLKIHPGNKAGVLILRSAEILAFPDSPGAAEPWLARTLLAKTGSKEKASPPMAESDALVTQSHPETDISIPKLKSRSPDANSKIASSIDAELLRLKRLGVEGKNSDDKNDVKPQESKASISISKTETDNSNAMPDNMQGNTHTDEIASKTAGGLTSNIPSIALTDFEDGRIFQHKVQRAAIVVSGTYQGQVEAIEARVVKSNTFEEIVAWTIIDDSPRNGIFVGELKNVPQGGWYNLQVRSHNDHTVAANGKHKWGVGMLIACLGQSNMKEWFYTGDELRAHSLLRKFNDSGWSKFGTTGNAAIAFGNRIIDRLGIPVGLMDYSINGSGLRKEADWGTGYWEDTTPNSIYDRFIDGVSNAGGAVEFVIWIQGEADAARGTVTKAEYADSLEHFITNQVRSDIANGSGRENLPLLVAMMIKRPGGKDGPHQDIRDAQRHIVENVADCYLAATTLDLKNHGRQHLTPKAYISMGNRVAQTVLYVLGKETYHRGPSVTNVKQIGNATLEITIKHNGGSDFTPATGITGWEVIANGASVPISKVYRHDPQTIRILLERPLDDKAQIRYLYGAMPDAKRPVLDNSPMSLPLEEFQADINIGCTPTPPDALGPFYKPKAPLRNSVGRGYELSGAVLSSKDCAPIKEAGIELWMAGPDGEYKDDYRAAVRANESGEYRFESHRPPSYLNRPLHIHIRVTADGFNTLSTQHYPEEDSSNGEFDLVLIPD
jgi:hypothetical protein